MTWVRARSKSRGGCYHAAHDQRTQSQDRRSDDACTWARCRAPLIAFAPALQFFAIRSCIAALSSPNSAYIRSSLLFAVSSSFTRLRSDTSIAPYFDFHW